MSNESNIDVSKMSDKALKMMGFSIETQIEAFLKDEGGSLSTQHWKIFWDILKHKKSNSVPLLLTMLLTFFTKKCIKGKSGSVPSIRVLNSIQFILLWHKLRENSSIKKLTKTFEDKIPSIDSPSVREGAEQVLKLLKLKINIENPVQYLIKGILEPRSKERIKCLHQWISNSGTGEIPASTQSPFLSAIFFMCNEPSVLQNVLKLLADELSNLQMDFTCSNVTMEKLFSVVHLIRSLLGCWVIRDATIHNRLSEELERFYSWPYPFSREVKDVLLKLKNELQWPGNGVLEQFVRDGRVPEVYDFPEDLADAFQKSRPLFYIIDSNSMKSSKMFSLLNIRLAGSFVDEKMDFDDDEYAKVLSTRVQAMFVLEFLNDALSAEERQLIYKMSKPSIKLLFDKALMYVDECLDLDIKKADIMRPMRLSRMKEDFLEKALSDSKEDTIDRLPAVLDDFTLRLGNMAHLAYLVGNDFEFPSQEDKEEKGFTSFPQTDFHKKLLSLLRTNARFAHETDPIELRIALTGDDSLIHRFLCSYLGIVTENPQLLVGIVLKVFIIPFEKSSVADYLALNDAWYEKYIYSPLQHDSLLLPSIEPDHQFSEPSSDDPPLLKLPQIYLRANIEHYVQSAEHYVPLKLYRIEGWFGPREDNMKKIGKVSVCLPDVIMPMLVSAEIGHVAEVSYFLSQGLGKKAEKSFLSSISFSLADPKTSSKLRDFRFSAPEVLINYTKLDLDNNAVVANKSIEQIPLPFQRISVSNLPTPDSLGHPANPRETFLELNVRTVEAKARQRAQKHWALMDPSQHVCTVDIQAVRKEHHFRVMVDGVHYGPFKSIRITPFEIEGRHMSLPIACFFPVEN